MSELKVETIIPQGTTVSLQMYGKGDVDALLAEKDAEIAELKERHKEEVDELQKATDSAWGKVNAMYDEILNHKYKRCLAMAKWCFDEGKGTPTVYEVRTFYWGRWGNIWLALAEKFKTNNQTAQ